MNTQAPHEKPSTTNPLPAIAAMPGTPLLKKLIGHGPRRPTPTPEEIALIQPVTKLLAASLDPAKPARAAQLIIRLIGHYPQQAMSDDIRAGIAEDWLEDLAHLPEDVIDAACAGWRRAENNSHRRPASCWPSPTQSSPSAGFWPSKGRRSRACPRPRDRSPWSGGMRTDAHHTPRNRRSV